MLSGAEMRAYEGALLRCSAQHPAAARDPVRPARYRNLAIARIVAERLGWPNMECPRPSVDLARVHRDILPQGLAVRLARHGQRKRFA